MEINFRTYQPGDEESILELFSLVYGKPLGRDVWNWRYLNNPYGAKKIILAFDGQMLIGHYAVSPIDFMDNNRVYKGGHSMTTMTHPAYQGRGLFTKLAKKKYEMLKAEGFDFIWGFPNRNSFYGFVKNLNWATKFEIPFLLCETPTSASIPFEVTSTPRESEDVNILLKNYSENFFLIKKDTEYFKWRYSDHPTYSYEILYFYNELQLCGISVTKEYEQDGRKYVDILELCALNTDTTDHILLWLREKFLHYAGFAGIFSWCGINDPQYLSFFKNKFLPKMPLTYMGFLPLSQTFSDKSRFLEWRLSMGDSDVF